MAISPIDMATDGYLNSPLSVATDGYLHILLDVRGGTSDKAKRMLLMAKLRREDEEILAIILAAVEVLDE